VNDPEIKTLEKKIVGSEQTIEGKVEAILKWLKPGRNIEFGSRKGTRWGVKNVLENKRGRCADFADIFVTLCRASGVPCRMVGGWIYEVGGHAWAEVLIEGKGWKQVDPTTGGSMNCGVYYIPYFTTETGEMPALYTSEVEIEVLKKD
jgi:transglutaminase-like putative cysteine protease